jgi:hypothetical protein
MARHFIIVLDGLSGAVLESDLLLHDYHRTEPCHFENRRDNPEKVLCANDSPIVSELSRTFARLREGPANVDFSGFVCEVETSGIWESDELRAHIEEYIRHNIPDADIDVVAL